MVVVTVANNRSQNSVSEGKADEDEYAKEEIANAKKGVEGGEGEVVKRVLKPNERLRSRGRHCAYSYLLLPVKCYFKIVSLMRCYDMIWYDMIWYGMIWYDMMIWYGMIWYDTV